MPNIAYAEDGVALLKQWIEASKDSEVCLFTGVDQGATNARVAIGRANGEFTQICKFQADSTRALLSGLVAVSDFVQGLVGGGDERPVKGGCVAAAGRIIHGGSCVEITNYAGGEENQLMRLDELPEFLFPKSHTRFLNDLEAACYGIAWLNQNRKLGEYFEQLIPPAEHKEGEACQGDSILLRPHHYLVQAAGTGLGVGLMMHFPGDKSHNVLPLEGGHVLLSPVGSADGRRAEEDEMLRDIAQKLYGGKYSLEYEDLVSGRGLFSLYEWIASKNPSAPTLSSPGEVAANANKDDPCPFASRALLLHYLYLARNSQNLVVGLNARGVFWAGDNQVSNSKFVLQNAERIQEELLCHPKREWLEDVPVYAQKKLFAVNIAGAIYIAQAYGCF